MNSKRSIALVALAVIIIGGLALAFRPRPVPVDAVETIRGPLTVVVEEEGKTRVIDRYVVSAPVSGFARRIELDVGDVVARGDQLLTLEPLRSDVLDPRSRAEAEARVQAARAALLGAQQNATAALADSEYADTELRRKEKLRADGTVSEEELDRARAQARTAAARLRSAQFSVDVSRHELDGAKTALEFSAAEPGAAPEKVSVTSPVDGRVLALVRESEGVVSAGQPLVEVGDPGNLEVEVEVLSIDAVKISPGTSVRFLRWGGDEPLEGVVRVIEPTGFTSPREEWERLGDGYRVEASFILWHGQDVLQVPSSAVFRHGGGWAVYVVDGDTAVLRPVTPGRRTGLEVEISDGLNAGDEVVVHPSDQVSDGVRIRRR
jgi:HlyD family secretion protein